jgi:hypothetical protein
LDRHETVAFDQPACCGFASTGVLFRSHSIDRTRLEVNEPVIAFTRMRSCAATPVSSVLDEWIVAEALVRCVSMAS